VGYAPQHNASLIFALWKDGHIVWSIDRFRGGPPYRAGLVSSKDVRHFFADIDDGGLFAEARSLQSWVPVDSDFISILVRSKGRQFVIRSRHELDKAKSDEGSDDKTLQRRHFLAPGRPPTPKIPPR
jgi:hypothetical protein